MARSGGLLSLPFSLLRFTSLSKKRSFRFLPAVQDTPKGVPLSTISNRQLLKSVRRIHGLPRYRASITTESIHVQLHKPAAVARQKKVHRRNHLQSVNSVVTSKYGLISANDATSPHLPAGLPRRSLAGLPAGPEPRRRAWPAHPEPSRGACPERSVGERSLCDLRTISRARRLPPASPIAGGPAGREHAKD
jgi:hypothetical protein